MKATVLLQELFPNQPIPSIEIQSVTESSVASNSHAVFVCICGTKADGHTYAADAYRRGCRVFVAQKPLELPSDALVLISSNTRKTLAILACKLYGDPSRRMRLIGVTGTKGKTTTAHLLTHLLNRAGIPCGYIGTNGITYKNTHMPSKNTTPDSVTLQKTLCDMQNADVHTAVIEVSSQALLQCRVDGTAFDTVLFTNLFPDHIGPNEHPNFENYKACKHRLFTDFEAKHAIYNADDAAAFDMLQGTSASHLVSCSAFANADYTALDITPFRNKKHLGVSFTMQSEKGSRSCILPLTGSMNVYNALLAVATAIEVFGVDLSIAVQALSDATVSGRSELIPLPNGACAVIDYAHNGESLAKLLSTLREYAPNRLIVLFGSIGERAQMRRGELGSVAASLSDLAILTSDNPANEPPEAIIADIAQAFEFSKTPYLSIPDRTEAIRYALLACRADDILVLAGKGHENYQLIGNQKIPFSERAIIAETVREIVHVSS